MEAMALGKPFIVSNLGGLPEFVDDGKNGYIYKTKEELAEDLKKITALSQEEYSAMCADSLERAKKSFNPIKYIEEMMKYYQG